MPLILIITAIIFALGTNALFYKITKRNWVAFLASILMAPMVGKILMWLVNSTILSGATGFGGVAAGIGAGIFIGISVICYVVIIIGISIYRWRKS